MSIIVPTFKVFCESSYCPPEIIDEKYLLVSFFERFKAVSPKGYIENDSIGFYQPGNESFWAAIKFFEYVHGRDNAHQYLSSVRDDERRALGKYHRLSGPALYVFDDINTIEGPKGKMMPLIVLEWFLKGREERTDGGPTEINVRTNNKYWIIDGMKIDQDEYAIYLATKHGSKEAGVNLDI